MPWSEENFLEKMAPQMRRSRGGKSGTCPNAATMLAVIEGEGDEWLRQAYAQHLEQCLACAELDSHLRGFDRPVSADEAEWQQAEKRLDNWINAVLNSTPAVSAVQAVEKPVARAGFWRSLWGPGTAWRVSLATALVALFAVGADLYLRLQPPVQPHESSVTANASPAAQSTASPIENPQPKPEAPRSPELQPQAPTPAPAPLPASGSPVYPRGPMAAVPKAAPTAKPQPQTETARAAPRGAPSETPAAGQEAEVTAAQLAKAEIAQETLPPAQPNPVPAEPQTQATAEPPPSSADSSATPHSEAPDLPARRARLEESPPPDAEKNAVPEAAGAPPVRGISPKTPRSLHFSAGTRFWIALDSMSRHAEGGFTFAGSLLLPLNSPGSSALDRGTAVSGSGTENVGKTSVLVSEIVVGGLHYKVKSENGGKSAAGSGNVVLFDSGKVFELWLSSDSTYERATADSQ